MAFSGIVTLAALPAGNINFVAQAQALCFILYGFRLSAYLLYREIKIPQIFQREAKGNPFARIPTILGCSLLYLCMAAPLRVSIVAGVYSPLAQTVAAVGLLFMYGGWALAAFGDYQKSYFKASKGSGLVTEGVFSLLRHPNYTGEQILWAGSFICSIAAGLLTTGSLPGTALAGWLLSSAAGTAGIWFVLLQATASLEKKQVPLPATAPCRGGGSLLLRILLRRPLPVTPACCARSSVLFATRRRRPSTPLGSRRPSTRVGWAGRGLDLHCRRRRREKPSQRQRAGRRRRQTIWGGADSDGIGGVGTRACERQ